MKKRVKIVLASTLALVLVLTGAFFIYVSIYYEADEIALEVLKADDGIKIEDNLTILSPSTPSDTALIFYPGAKVEHTAYLPILDKIRKNGITCILVKMPFNMAIFDSDAADNVFEKLPDIKNWYIGGHSMGGAMASDYFAKNSDKLRGVILLGAYIYGDVDPTDALTVYGTLNTNIPEHIDYTENIVVIEGGNHAQFGNYGEQIGDPPATISREEQQDIAVEAIVEFIKEKSKE